MRAHRAVEDKAVGDEPDENRTVDNRVKKRGGWRLWLGWLLIAGGVGLLGYVAWQFYGTNWVAKQRQNDITASIERQWQEGRDPEVQVGGGLAGGGAKETVTADALIRIPRFGDDYVIPVLEGTSDAVLAAGYGHFSETAGAGEVGNYALAAHRVTHGEPLRDMPDLQPGDEVIVETKDATYTYVLDTGGDDLVVPFTAGWVLEPVPYNPDGGVQPKQLAGQRLITLTTCSELFHTDNRMIAFGHLVDTVER